MTTEENLPELGVPPLPESTPQAAAVRRQIPGFQMLGLLGRGGMGVVYQARQEELNRIVAIKMIRSAEDADSEELIRFRIEAETVARLQHENIVQLFQIGEADGLPFLAFEYVDGGSLAEKIAGTAQPIDESVYLVETLARAVHYAHNHGIVHRDLKPANVLLTTAGVPKIADFGLALQQERAGQAMSGAIRGTPAYMSPEQAWGSTGLETIGPAADVYALGVILYEMLVGKPPFQAGTARELLEQVWAGQPQPPRDLRSEIPPDLEIICLRCLHKDPAGRYATAEALAEDLRRLRHHEPITARSISRLERTKLWCRRKPYEAFLIGALAASLVVGILGIAVKWYEADKNWKTAQHNLRTAEVATATAKAAEGRARVAEDSALRERDAAVENLYAFLILGATRSLADGNRRAAEEYLRRCPPEQRHVEWQLLLSRCLGSHLTLDGHSGEVTSTAFSRDGKRLATSSTKDPVRIWNVVTGEQLAEIGGPARQVLFAPTGTELIVLTHDLFGSSELQSWDIETGKQLATLATPVGRCAFNPDGKYLAVRQSTGRVDLLSVPDWETTATIDLGAAIGTARHRLESTLFRQLSDRPDPADDPVTAPVPNSLPQTTTQQKLEQSESPRIDYSNILPQVPWLNDHTNKVLAWSADGSRLLIGVQTPLASESNPDAVAKKPRLQSSILVFNVRQNEAECLVELREGDQLGGIATSGDGHTLFAAVVQQQSARHSAECAWSVIRFDLESKRALSPFEIHPRSRQQQVKSLTKSDRPSVDAVTLNAGSHISPQLALSADGSRLAVTCRNTLAILDSQTGRQIALHQGHRQPIVDVQFRPTGVYCASAGGADGTAKVWDVEHAASDPQQISPQLLGNFADARRAAFSSDGRFLAAANDDGSIRLYDFDEARGSQLNPLQGSDVPEVTPSSDAQRDPNDIGLTVRQLPQQLAVTALRWRINTHRLIAVYSARIIAEIDVRTWPPQTTILFDSLLYEADEPFPLSRQLQLSPDGRYLLVRTQRDRQLNVTVRDIESRRQLATHSIELTLAAEAVVSFTDDCRSVLIEDRSATDLLDAVVVDLKTGKQIDRRVEELHRVDPDSVSPDRRRIIHITREGRIQFLAAASGRILVTDQNARTYYWAKFSPDNKRLLVSSQRGIEQFQIELSPAAMHVHPD